MAPSTSLVPPVHIVRSSGPVTDAKALTDPSGHGATTLTMRPGAPAPTVIVDYGKDVGGVPYFVVTSESRSPVLRVLQRGVDLSRTLRRRHPERERRRRPGPGGQPDRVLSRETLDRTHPGGRAL